MSASSAKAWRERNKTTYLARAKDYDAKRRRHRQTPYYKFLQELRAMDNDQQEREIQSGMFQWEPGTLPPETLNRILIDVLADLWNVAGRVRPSHEEFCDVITEAIKNATGYRANAYLYAM